MTPTTLSGFEEIWFFDFEYRALPGERAEPICMVAKEMASGKCIRLWGDALRGTPPSFLSQDNALVMAYYASAEIGCLLALEWPVPANVLDLFVEFRVMTNGQKPPCGNSLLGALSYFGLGSIGHVEKGEMRNLAIRGGPFTPEEKCELMDYCQEDVDALGRLLTKMDPKLDVPRALLRGRYMKAVARIEHVGVPIDVEAVRILKERWSMIQGRLIERVDQDYGVYEDGKFKQRLFLSWVNRHAIPWPRTPTGLLKLDDDTFEEMARTYPFVSPLRELRRSLSQMRGGDITVGADGRNRMLLSPFGTITGRNAPSTTKSAFGRAAWMRSLIRPTEGFGLAYIDWAQQEFGIAAALSRDGRMMAAYQSGDPYLEFGKQAGVIPIESTKESHQHERENLKQCVLATQYGMGAESLSGKIGKPPAYAQSLLDSHRSTYPNYWRWSEAAVASAVLHGSISTAFGWTIRVGPRFNTRSVANFPMQANGAEMLYIACILATEGGVRICMPVHDAVLIEAPLGELDQRVAQMQESMAQASKLVLDGFVLRSDVKLIEHPDRYVDERGRAMWELVWGVVREIEAEEDQVDSHLSVEEVT